MDSLRKVAEVRVGKLAANLVGTVLSLLLCVIMVVLAQALPYRVEPTPADAIGFFAGLVLLIPVHEAMHMVALMIWARLPVSAFKFGVMWRALMPYCLCKVPVTVRAFRRNAVFPLLVTGTLTLASLAIRPTPLAGLLAGIAIAACVGDLWLLLKLRSFAGDLLVQDHPSEIGCDVFARETEVPPHPTDTTR